MGKTRLSAAAAGLQAPRYRIPFHSIPSHTYHIGHSRTTIDVIALWLGRKLAWLHSFPLDVCEYVVDA